MEYFLLVKHIFLRDMKRVQGSGEGRDDDGDLFEDLRMSVLCIWWERILEL
jgi:hypothetical protein